MIEVRGVTKTHYGEVVLDDVTLTVEQGHQLALIGPGGAGKTLLMKIMAGLVKPDEGEVLIDGEDISAMDEVEIADVRWRMGMLFQNYALFDFMDVEDNIAFPLRQEAELDDSEIREKVASLLEQVGLPGIQHQYPNELSGGMKKRVTFARAVIRRPEIVFYDDPTAGLDPVTSSKIFRLLEDMQAEYAPTTLVITHDLGGVQKICDHFAMMDAGRLVFSGTQHDIEHCPDPRVRNFWEGKAE